MKDFKYKNLKHKCTWKKNVLCNLRLQKTFKTKTQNPEAIKEKIYNGQK